MDAHLFRRFCEAATPLLMGCRIEKLQEASPGLLVLSLYGNGQKRRFCLRHDRKEPFCFFSGTRLTAGAAPTAAVMRLRKYAVGRRIAAMVPQFRQRRLWFLLAGSPEKEGGALPAGYALWLLLDLREGASLHFQPPEGADRPASPLPLPPESEAPAWPEPGELQEALDNWRDWPVLTPALRRSLVHMEEPDQWALMEDLRAGGGDVFLYTEAAAHEMPGAPVRAVSAWPLPAELGKGLVEEAGEDVIALTERAARSLVLGRIAEAGEAERARPVQRRLRKVAKLLEKLDDEERRLKAMTSRQTDALALSANLWRWGPEARAEWVEIPDEPDADGAPRRIRLDPRHDIRANMERLFHAAKRGRRGLTMLGPRRAALLEEAETLRRALGGAPLPDAEAQAEAAPGGGHALPLPRNLPRRVQAFVSEDGFQLWRGRDARGNQALLRKARPWDIWLHAEGGPGAHVLIRRSAAAEEVPERTLEQAGSLAACKSWRRDAASARILYAEARHVRPLRGAAPGTVRMDKILATREVAVDPELETRLVHS